MTVLWDTDVKGFGCRRHNTEGRHYLLRYRFNGRQTFRKIGRHGSPFTPEMARTEALRLLGLIVSGTNPNVVDRQGDTFAQELSRYLDSKRTALKPRAYANTEHHLRKQAQPLHALALADIDRRTIAQLLSAIERGAGPTARNRLRSSLSAFFAWLIREGLHDTNPVQGTGKASEGPSRDRVLTQAELVAIWRALAQDDASDIIRLLLLTGQRRNEIAGLRWSEIDWDRAMLVLPPERTKNKLRHELPLAPIALAILRKRWANGKGKENDAPVFRSPSWTHAKARLDSRLRIADWRLHDLRRTCATMLGDKLGVFPHIIEAVLNHVSGHKGGVAGIYNRAKYADEMREALQRWADHVEALIVGPRKQPVPIGLMERAFAVARAGKIVPDEDLANLARQLKTT
jgi:integrase